MQVLFFFAIYALHFMRGGDRYDYRISVVSYHLGIAFVV